MGRMDYNASIETDTERGCLLMAEILESKNFIHAFIEEDIA